MPTPLWAPRIPAVVAASIGATLSACGGSDAIPWSDSFPTLLSAGGPTLATPTALPVFFANEDPATIALVVDFLGKLAGSSHWTATTSEYGVGPLAVAKAITLDEMPPAEITEAAVAHWVEDAVAAGVLPAPTPGVIYTIYPPSGTKVTSRTGGVSCVDFGAYHGEVQIDGEPVAIAVIPRCERYDAKLWPGDALEGDAFITALTSHELMEAATDPAVETDPAYVSIDFYHHAWKAYLLAGENADTCERQQGAFRVDPAIGYVVQSGWSNEAAAAGRDPCVPSDGPYIGAFPRMPTRTIFGKDAAAVDVPVGGTATIEVDLRSERADSAPWTVTALDYETVVGGAPRLELSLNAGAGENGDVLTLTLHVLSFDASGQAGFVLESALGSKITRVPGVVVAP